MHINKSIYSFLCIKWSEAEEEPSSWYRARIDQYFQDKSCKIVYDDSDSYEVSEVVAPSVALHEIEWKPCSKRARKFVPLDGKPIFTKVSWKPSLKYADSMEHSLKGYADDFDTHKSVLQLLDLKATDLDLAFKPSKCISFLFNGIQMGGVDCDESRPLRQAIGVGEKDTTSRHAYLQYYTHVILQQYIF